MNELIESVGQTKLKWTGSMEKTRALLALAIQFSVRVGTRERNDNMKDRDVISEKLPFQLEFGEWNEGGQNERKTRKSVAFIVS